MSDQTGLASTLKLALSQCREQDLALLARDNEIRCLKEDNARLHTRISELDLAGGYGRTYQDQEWAQTLLQKHVEAEAEIAYLKRKLKAYSEMLHQNLPTPVVPSTSLPEMTAAATAPAARMAKRKDTDGQASASPPLIRSAKRGRVEIQKRRSTEPVHSGNERSLAPEITALTEDGEDYSSGITGEEALCDSSLPPSDRLTSLLERPQLNKVSLRQSHYGTLAVPMTPSRSSDLHADVDHVVAESLLAKTNPTVLPSDTNNDNLPGARETASTERTPVAVQSSTIRLPLVPG